MRVVSDYITNLDADGAAWFVVAVSGAGMLPTVITVKMEPDTEFAIIRFSSCFYEVALNEELALSSIYDSQLIWTLQPMSKISLTRLILLIGWNLM